MENGCCTLGEPQAFFDDIKSHTPKSPPTSKAQHEGQKRLGAALVGITLLASIHWAITLLEVAGSVVPDASTGPPVGAVAVPHPIWALSGLMVYYVLTQTMYFGVYFQLARIHRQLWFLISVLALDAATKVVHLILLALELARNQTNLVRNVNSAFGFQYAVTLTILQGFSLGLDGWLLYQVVSYKRRLDKFFQAGWRPGLITARSRKR